MLTYRDLIENARDTLFDVSESPRIDAEILLQHVLNKPLAWLIAYDDLPANNGHVKAYLKLVTHRQQGQPIAYIIGYREFWTLKLTVTPDVLIPRPDTEILVEKALQRIKGKQPCDLLDLGTGSGAIALALAKERPLATVLAVDNSISALAIAENNARQNQVENIRFSQSDWFSALQTNKLTQKKFDLIASNPPYIEANDTHLSQGDLRFEPLSALTSGGDGLIDLRTIISGAPDHLNENGWLIVEHGHNQADQVAELFSETGFKQISMHKDLNNLPRCTVGLLDNGSVG